MTRQFHKNIRRLISASVFIFFLLFLMGKLPSRFIDNFEQQLYDFRLRTDLINTPQHPSIDERIVILDIDEKSISELGHWPWSRTVLSELMERLFNDYEIKVIGFDIVFPEQELSAADELVSELKRLPEFSSPEISGLLEQTSTLVDGDNRLAESIAARNVVVGYTFEQFAGDEYTYQQKGVLSEPVIYQEQLSESNLELALYNAGGFVANYEYLTYATLYGGFFNYPRESSTLRKVPLLYNYEGSFYPSLALQTALVALEEEQVEFLFDPNSTEKSSLTLEYLKVGERIIPVDGQASVYVPYRGGSYSFPYVSSVDVLNGRIDKATLRDKILLFGTTATGLVDLRATPVNDSFPGVEVHANIIAGILDERFKLKPSYTIAIEVIMLLILTGMLHYVLPRFGALGTFIISPLAFILVFFSGYFTWHNLNLVIPMASSILLVATLIFLHVLYDFFVESRQKRRMNTFFEQYIPAELVKELDQEERELTLSGDSREMTVLFSDVRNFTTLSESMEPGELTQLMNEFLTPIT